MYAGYTVPPYYDSLLAKVIVHGNDRAEALARMGQALDSFILEGVTTTIPFLSRSSVIPTSSPGRWTPSSSSDSRNSSDRTL